MFSARYLSEYIYFIQKILTFGNRFSSTDQGLVKSEENSCGDWQRRLIWDVATWQLFVCDIFDMLRTIRIVSFLEKLILTRSSYTHVNVNLWLILTY